MNFIITLTFLSTYFMTFMLGITIGASIANASKPKTTPGADQ